MQAAKRLRLAQRSHGELNEAGFNLRETITLPRNILHSLGVTSQADTGQRPHPFIDGRGWDRRTPSPKDVSGNWIYPLTGRDTVKNGIGWS